MRLTQGSKSYLKSQKKAEFELSGYNLQRREGGTNTTFSYDIYQESNKIGYVSLIFILKEQKISFDIFISESGKGRAIRVLQELASYYHDKGLKLITGGVSSTSKEYWQKLLEKELVKLDLEAGATNYVVLPSKTSIL